MDDRNSTPTSVTHHDPQRSRRDNAQERRFLHGPQPRRFELRWAMRAFWDLIRGFRALGFLGPCVTVFGSARFGEDNPYYAQTRKLGEELVRAGFSVITGGGPGLMEAANRGAREAGGHSVGCNITLPLEQQPNPYLDTFIEFRHFFVRKVMLVKYSYAFVAAPGGFGTLDELFEVATLVQTGKVKNFPIILMGSEYWAPLMDFLRERLLRSGAIDAAELDFIRVVDSPEEIARHILDVGMKQFGLSFGPSLRRRWFLFEFPR